MALGAIAIMTGIGIFGGFVAGSLSRQPEINELKKQVKSLQAEVERLQGVVRVQNNEINELKIRYTALRGWNYMQKAKQRGYIKGSIMFQYALKEYLEMLIDANESNAVRMNDREVKFYNAFGTTMNKAEINDKNRKIVLDYVREKYGTKIDNYEEPDLSEITEYFE